MSTLPPQGDVFDPTTDPRHVPPATAPGPDPDTARPRNVTLDQPPPPDEPVITQPGPTSSPKRQSGTG
jgi:hypothetical protein